MHLGRYCISAAYIMSNRWEQGVTRWAAHLLAAILAYDTPLYGSEVQCIPACVVFMTIV